MKKLTKSKGRAERGDRKFWKVETEPESGDQRRGGKDGPEWASNKARGERMGRSEQGVHTRTG